ncbi:MAG TPA: ABC transporter permease [Sphingomicrobium sp.]|nr:ABC transporter permease [Sphingomicrobium sp.]
MAPAVLEVQNVERVYQIGDVEVHALRGVDLSICRGEFVAIMGSSGSGKSTLMAILGCLDRATTGHYIFEGVDVAELSEPDLARIRSERIGFVFQTFNLLARTSALENVALPLFYIASGPKSRADRLARSRSALAALGLAERENSTPGQLSGGQQQRVAIARALINDPVVLLADEPTGNLDTRTSHEIMEILTKLNRERGLTIVLVTHEADIAAFADRVITMRDGEIISDTRNSRKTETPAPASGNSAWREDSLNIASRPSARTKPQLHFSGMILGAALQALARNKTRSALTMLGVFIGVAALIAMVAIGQGANEAVRKQINSLGTNLLVVVPGATTTRGVRGGFGSSATLTVSDAEAIQREATAVTDVSYFLRQSAQVQNGNQNWTTSIQGISPTYSSQTNWTIAAGRQITEADENSASMVAVIGQTVYEQLFGNSANPLGATILIRGAPLEVVGVLAAKGQTMMGQDQDDVVMIPFTAAERKVLGVAAPVSSQSSLNSNYLPPSNPFGLQPKLTGRVNNIVVQAAADSEVPQAIAQVTQILRRTHRIPPGQDNDFSVRNLSQIANAASGAGRIMALLLAVVASISLLVGGIGIMNILLVSVTERTREIGLRMAIGARRLQVLLQFLAEAVLLSVMGGLVGILGGIAASILIAATTGWSAPISVVAIAVGFLFSAAVGIFFGYYPARKAARLNPIDALRFE